MVVFNWEGKYTIFYLFEMDWIAKVKPKPKWLICNDLDTPLAGNIGDL